MGAISRHLGLRLFLEGIEVPVIGAVCSTSVMSSGTAKITVPASDALHHLLPRTIVHLWFYDNANIVNRLSVDPKDPEASKQLGVDAQDPDRWKLLYVGELFSYSYTRRETTRFGVLKCVGFTSYWNQAKIYWGTKAVTNKSFKQAVFMGSVTGTGGGSDSNAVGKFKRILKGQPSTAPSLTGLMGGVIHLLESITGVFASSAGSKYKFRGVSDFMSQAELRLHLTRTMGFNPNDTSSLNLMGSRAYKQYVNKLVGGLKGTNSYGDLVRMLLGRTFHQYTPVLCPPYLPKGGSTVFKQLVPIYAKRSGKAKGPRGKLLKQAQLIEELISDRQQKTLGRAMTSGHDNFADKPDDIGGIEPDNEGAKAFEDKANSDGIITVDQSKELYNEVKNLTSSGDNADLPKSERAGLVLAAQALESSVTILRNELMYKSKGLRDTLSTVLTGKHYPLHTSAGGARAAALAQAAQIHLKKRSGPKYKTIDVKKKMRDRLITTFFSPLIWMCPPPMCNIMFPEHVRSFNFQRNWFSETTRYWLYGMSKQGKANWTKSYFAPNSSIITGDLDVKDVAKAAGGSISFLFPHERFGGIVPKIQGIGDVATLENINKEVEKLESERDSIRNKSFLSNSSNVKDPAINRAAHAHFFRERYASRRMSVEGPFNPYLIAGLPAAVIDAADGSSHDNRPPWARGVHFLGYITSLVHRITQKGATTQAHMGFSRTHNEGLDVFGTYNATATVQEKVKQRKFRGKKLGGVFWAEVLGFRTVKRKGSGPGSGWLRRVPIVGMGGKAGRTGRHIALGLFAQSGNIEVTPTGSSGTLPGEQKGDKLTVDYVGGIPSRDSNAGVSSRGTGNLASVDVKLGKKAGLYSISPIYSKKADQSQAAAPVSSGVGVGAGVGSGLGPQAGPVSFVSPTVGKPVVNDGFTYATKFSWMSSKAKMAVKVNAFLRLPPAKAKTFDLSFSFEQVARPPWFDKSYLNSEIGPSFYQQLFGCGSITDTTVITDYPVPGAIGGETLNMAGKSQSAPLPLTAKEAHDLRNSARTPEEKLFDLEFSYEEVFEGKDQSGTEGVNAALNEYLIELGMDSRKTVLVKDVNGREFAVPGAVLGGVPIQLALEQISRAYHIQKEMSSGGSITDLDNFLNKFNTRKFASMTEVFGRGYRLGELDPDPKSDSMDFSVQAKKGGVVGTNSVQPFEYYDPSGIFSEESDDAREGFHSSAFGDHTDLNLLPHEKLADVHGGNPRELNPKVDPRADRYQRVLYYRDSLGISKSDV